MKNAGIMNMTRKRTNVFALVLDEDEYVRFCEEQNKTCRYFRPSGSEYDIVRKQN